MKKLDKRIVIFLSSFKKIKTSFKASPDNYSKLQGVFYYCFFIVDWRTFSLNFLTDSANLKRFPDDLSLTCKLVENFIQHNHGGRKSKKYNAVVKRLFTVQFYFIYYFIEFGDNVSLEGNFVDENIRCYNKSTIL